MENHIASYVVPNFSDWACNPTQSTHISLVEEQKGNSDSAEPVISKTFQPTYTHAIFDTHETVFGYKDLNIKLQFTSGSLRPYLQIDSSERYTAPNTSPVLKAIQADDIEKLLAEYLPEDYIKNYDSFIDAVKSDAKTFKPIGEKIAEYTREENQHYEIYKSSFSNVKFREYHRRMRLFIIFFIETGLYIDDEDDEWEIYTIFKKEDDTYHFVGYCTTYPYYYWPENIRMRISQFVMLPPYKKKGHGSKLYQTIYEIFKSRQEISEITVESPGEEFADMRDKCDYKYLYDHGAFNGLKAPVSDEIFTELRKTYKLTDRQTHRCVEIYLLSKLNKLNEEEYKAYRLQVKKRLYEFNFDGLQSEEPSKRNELLHQGYLGVEDEYHGLLEILH